MELEPAESLTFCSDRQELRRGCRLSHMRSLSVLSSRSNSDADSILMDHGMDEEDDYFFDDSAIAESSPVSPQSLITADRGLSRCCIEFQNAVNVPPQKLKIEDIVSGVSDSKRLQQVAVSPVVNFPDEFVPMDEVRSRFSIKNNLSFTVFVKASVNVSRVSAACLVLSNFTLYF